MANRRFIDFPIASTVGDNDIVLIWQDGANKQTTKATILSGLPENLEDLNDVAISGLTNGQILRYDSVTGKWENTDQGNLDLNDLNDVSIVSPSNGQVLVYNSSTSKWENSSGGFVPYTGAVTTVNLGAQTIQAGQFIKAGGTASQFLKADGSIDSTAYGTGSVTSVALTMPSAFNVANSPITTAGTLAVTGSGTVGQYIRGDGSLADFPQASGGGSSVSYYLNGSVNQGTIGGVAYRELSKVPILGAGTDFTINADGYIASFITDAGDPNLLEIPGGNWNFETYFSASSSGGTPTFYVELYKYDGTTFTLIASSSSAPELIAFGTNLNPYFSTLAVPTTTLALTDRLAIRYYVTHSGRTITLHTENNHLCQVITTFTTGLTSLNGLTAQVQNLAVGTSGTDFNIVSATATHTFNLPTASATNRGALSSADWTTFNNKQNALGYVAVPETRTLTINGVTQDLSANRTFNVGTVTSVGLSSATSGVTIGSTPVTSSGTITLAIATASGSQNGLLSSTDWTTFNNKQNALTNPVTGTGASGQVAYFNGTTTITSESNLFWDATNDRLGIGTSSPTERLEVNGNGLFSSSVKVNTSGVNTSLNAVSSGLQLVVDGSTGSNRNITFNIASTEAMRIDNNLNLGLGVTPSAWSTSFGIKVIDVGNQGTFYASDNDANISFNQFFNGTNAVYKTTGTASRFALIGNEFQWRQAPSGTAGNAISFTQAMTLTSGGNLLVGTTTDNGARLQVSGTATFSSGVTATELTLNKGASDTIGAGSYVYYSNVGGTRGAVHQLNASFGLDTFTFDGSTWSRRMTVTNNGNVGIGTSSPSQKLVVQESGDAFIQIRNNSVGQNFFIGALNGETRLNNDNSTPITMWVNGSERMRITSSGNVGIGTSSPSAKLHIDSPTSGASGEEMLRITRNTAGQGIRLMNYDGGSGIDGFTLKTLGSTNLLHFRMDGNVGIGTSSPSQALSIGDGTSSKYIRIQGSIADSFIGSDSVGTFFGNNSNVPLYINTNGTERMRITSGGNVLIGTTTDNGFGRVQINGNITLAGNVRFSSSGADANRWSVYWNGGTGDLIVVNNISDIRAKKDFDYDIKGLETITKLKPLKFTWKDGTSHSTSVSGRLRQYGFIAQETMQADDYLAWHNERQDTWGIEQYESFCAVIVKAIQELKQEIDTLKN